MIFVYETFPDVAKAIDCATEGSTIRCSSEALRRKAFRYAQFRQRNSDIQITANAMVEIVHSNDDLYEGDTRKSRATLKLVRLH